MNASPRILVAQLGARRHYAVPRAFASGGCLERIVTDACAQVAPWTMMAVLPSKWRTGHLRRIWDRQIRDVDRARVQGCLRFTISRQLRRFHSIPARTQADEWVLRNEAFGRTVSALDWGAADTIYAFNGCALEVFLEARRRGLRCVLDQSAAPWRYNTALIRREQERWPGWEDQPADIDTTGQMIQREEEEWSLADRIVCGSKFVVSAIAAVGGPVEKSTVVTYPVPTAPPAPSREARDGKTRVLFVGSLQLRKGIQYFSQVAQRLAGDRFVFRAIGPSLLTPSAERIVRESVDWYGVIPRSGVWEHYRWGDVLLLPTLSEGSANACLEAARSGLTIITSAASGLAACDERTILTRASDTAAIVAQLKTLASSQPEAPKTPIVCERSIADYGRDLIGAVAAVHNHRRN